MNSFAEHFLEIILKHCNTLNQSFEYTIRDRNEFSSRLTTIPYIKKVFDSSANFILVKLKGDNEFAADLTNTLLSQKTVFVKNVSPKFSDGAGYLRLAVRTQKENDELIGYLAELDKILFPLNKPLNSFYQIN